MTNEERLSIAQKRYPIGTKFRCAGFGKEHVLERFDVDKRNHWNTADYIIVYVEGVSGCGKYLYKNGKWADIISTPNQEKGYELW